VNTEIVIASVSHREEVVAEIWCDDRLWAEVSQDEGYLLLSTYPHPSGEPWVLPLDMAVRLLQEAASELRGGPRPGAGPDSP
jgi:hypothetical protein